MTDFRFKRKSQGVTVAQKKVDPFAPPGGCFGNFQALRPTDFTTEQDSRREVGGKRDFWDIFVLPPLLNATHDSS